MNRPKAISRPPEEIPLVMVGAGESDVLFLHANGYPPECYALLLAGLARDFRVRAMVQRPLWSGYWPDSLNSWHCLSDDLGAFMEQQHLGPVPIVGHSMGAVVALRSVLRDPAKFAALVLIDPVLNRASERLLGGLVRFLQGDSAVKTAILRTLGRRRHFRNVEDAFRGYRSRPVFRRLTDAKLRAVIAGITIPLDTGGHALRYSPEWEARIYRTAFRGDRDVWRQLPALRVPTLVIRGAESETLDDATCKRMGALSRWITVRVIPESSHLVALERPTEVCRMIGSFLTDEARSHAATGQIVVARPSTRILRRTQGRP